LISNVKLIIIIIIIMIIIIVVTHFWVPTKNKNKKPKEIRKIIRGGSAQKESEKN
jgi:FtsZ-interacting cell division protein ZipA